MRHYTYILFSILNLLSIVGVAQKNINEYQLKTTLIFKFGENIFWPNESPKDTFIIAIIGNNSKMQTYLARAARNKKIRNHKVIIKIYKDFFFEKIPNIIYVTPQFNFAIKRLRKLSYGFPILLITENLNSPEDIMINLFRQNNRILFQINNINILNQKLITSASLLLLGAKKEDIIYTYQRIENKLTKTQNKIISQNLIIKENKNRIAQYSNYTKFQREKLDSLKKIIQKNNDSLRHKESLIKNEKRKILKIIDSINNKEKSLKKQLITLQNSKLELAEKQKDIIAFNSILNNSQNRLDQRNKDLINRNNLIKNQKRVLRKSKNQYIYYWFLLSIFGILSLVLLILYLDQFKNNKKASQLKKQNFSFKKKLIASEEAIKQINTEKEAIKKENLENTKKLSTANLYTSKVKQILFESLAKFDYIYDNFNVFLSKESNSSDFFFFWNILNKTNLSEKYIIGLGDTNKTGIPATQTAILSHQLLKEIVFSNSSKGISEIFNLFNKKFTQIVENIFFQSRPQVDCSLILIEKIISNKIIIHFIGANLPLIMYKREEKKSLIIRASRKKSDNFKFDNKRFEETKIEATRGDMLYLLTDGLLTIISHNRENSLQAISKLINRVAILPLDKQKEIVLSSIRTKLGNSPLKNDISIVGIRL